MRFIKKKVIPKTEMIAQAAERYEKTEAQKQIVGHRRVKHPNEPAVNVWIDEDGAEIIEDEQGNAVDRKMLENPVARARNEPEA